MNATRRAPVLSGTKFSCKPPRKQKCRREKFTARLFRRKPKPPTEQPFAPPKTSISTEALSCIVGNPNSRRTTPGRAREGRNPLAPRRPRGCRGAERPTPVPSETTSSKGQPASSETNIPTRTPPGRARESVNPLDFQSRPATCAAERLLAQRASKSLRDRPSEIEDFGWSSPGADFFGVGACPPEKKSLPCRFRARKSKGFQRNLRKGGAEGNPSPPPPGVFERAAALSTFNQTDFRMKSYPFSRGWQWRGELAPPSTSRFAFIR